MESSAEDQDAAVPGQETAPPATPRDVINMRWLAAAALAALVATLFLSFRPWWIDQSALSGPALNAAIAAAPDATAKECLVSGGVMIGMPSSLQCAHWRVLQPATGLKESKPNTISAAGASVVNKRHPGTLLSLPSATVFAALAFALVIVALATRSLLASTLAFGSAFQTFRTLSELKSTMLMSSPGLPPLQPTLDMQLFQAVAVGVCIMTTIGTVALLVIGRLRERKKRIADGTHEPFADRFRALAATAARMGAAANAARPHDSASN